MIDLFLPPRALPLPLLVWRLSRKRCARVVYPCTMTHTLLSPRFRVSARPCLFLTLCIKWKLWMRNLQPREPFGNLSTEERSPPPFFGPANSNTRQVELLLAGLILIDVCSSTPHSFFTCEYLRSEALNSVFSLLFQQTAWSSFTTTFNGVPYDP